MKNWILNIYGRFAVFMVTLVGVLSAPVSALADGQPPAPQAGGVEKWIATLQGLVSGIPSDGTFLIVAGAVFDFVSRLAPTEKARGLFHLVSDVISGTATVFAVFGEACGELSHIPMMKTVGTLLGEISQLCAVLSSGFSKLAQLLDRVLPQNLKSPAPSAA